MKKIIMMALIAVITGIMLMGCEKEKSLCEKSIPTTYSIREFVSINQLCEEIKYIGQLDYDSIVTYESSKNFQSYGTLAYNALERVTVDTTISLRNLMGMVSMYNDYLHIYSEEDDDYYLDVKYDNSPYTFIVNEDRMFAVDNKLYKVFEDCIVITTKSNFDSLLNLDDADVKGIEDNNNYNIIPIIINHGSVNTGSASNIKVLNEEGTEGKERIKSNLSCSILGYPQSIGGFKRTTVGLSLKSKAFRKFVVFWPVKRTISHHISAGMDFEGGMYNGSDYGSSFGFSRENILVAKTIDVQPYRNPEYGVHSAYGYVRIPAVKAEYNYPN